MKLRNRSAGQDMIGYDNPVPAFGPGTAGRDGQEHRK